MRTILTIIQSIFFLVLAIGGGIAWITQDFVIQGRMLHWLLAVGCYFMGMLGLWWTARSYLTRRGA